MDHITITEKNSVLRMLGREAMKPSVWLTIAGVLFFSIILDVPSLIWGGSAWTAEEIQKIITDYFQLGILPQVPRYYYIDALYTFLIMGPLTYGLCAFLLKIFRRKPTGTLEIFLGFANFKNAFLFHLIQSLFVIVGFALLVVPGVFLAYSYAMGYYLMNDDPELKPVEALKLSRSLMKGNRWKLFTLHISFIGWSILLSLAVTLLAAVSGWLGVFVNVFLGALLSAYVHLSEIAFYEMLVGHLHRVAPEEVRSNAAQ